jgi:hypothetical protein
MDVKFSAATTATSAAPLSSNPTVNAASFGVAMSCVKRARKRKKSTLADERVAPIPQEQLLLMLKILFHSLYDLQISFVSEISSC